jgi:hypothetical protein
MLAAMILSPAPSLAFVIGLPAGLMLVVGAVSFAAYTLIGRIGRG